MEEIKDIVTAENADELIVISQLPVIREQLQKIKSKVEETVASALALEVTEESVTEIKKKRAELNKIAAEFEARRKEIKKSILAPYERFEATYKDCVIDAFNAADAELKKRIAAVEDGVKKRKQEEIETYFEEYAKSLNLDFVTFDRLQIKVTISDSVKKYKEIVKSVLDRIYSDVEMIATLADADEIMAEYKTTLNATLAVTTVVNRHKAVEEEKRRAEERRNAEAVRAEAERRAKEALDAQMTVETLSAPAEEIPAEEGNGVSADSPIPEEEYSATFTVFGTIEQLKDIKKYLNERGIRYECE